MSASDPGFKSAVKEAEDGFNQGGVPIGACLVSKDGKILGSGHNMRVQNGSAILHGERTHEENLGTFNAGEKAEMSALENAGRLPASTIAGGTMYTTLSPCDMCTGACLLYKIKRVVIGENKTYVGGEELLKSRGVEVVVLDDARCRELMKTFAEEKPDLWKANTDEWS